MDRGAWQATVHRVSKSWTLLKWLSMHAFTMNEIVHFFAFSYASFIFTPCNHHTGKTYWTSTMGQVLHTDSKIFRPVISLQIKMLRPWTAYHDHKGSRGYVVVENVNAVFSLKASGLLFFLKNVFSVIEIPDQLFEYVFNYSSVKLKKIIKVTCMRPFIVHWNSGLLFKHGSPKWIIISISATSSVNKIIKPKGILYSLRS